MKKIFLAAVLMLGLTGCLDTFNSIDNTVSYGPTDDHMQQRVRVSLPTAVLSQFDETSMGAALVRRLPNTTSEIQPNTKMVLIKGEDILSRPLTEWLEAARIYLEGGYIAVEKPHNAHLVHLMEQLANKFAQAEDKLLMNNGITIVRPATNSTLSRSDEAERFKVRIANIEAKAGTRGDTNDHEAVAELVIFACDGYYSCAPTGKKNILMRVIDKEGNVKTENKSIEQEYTLYETGLQADGAANWLNTRDKTYSYRRAGTRGNGTDAINDLMSADEEHNYQGPLCGFENGFSYPIRVNAFNEIIRTWGVHNIETKKDYYFVEQKIVASVGGEQGGDGRFDVSKTLYRGPYAKDEFEEFSGGGSYGSWFGRGEYAMTLSGNGNIVLEDAQPSSDNNEGSKTIGVGTFEATTTTIGGTITPGFSQKMGASITGSGTFSTGYTQGTVFFMSSTVNYKELTCQKNTEGTQVSWTYGCGPDMMDGDWDEHPLAPDALIGDVDINNQACWSVSNPVGNYTLTVDQNTWMHSIDKDNDEEEKCIKETSPDDTKTLSITLLTPNRSKQIWNMDITFPEITQDGYNEVKPKLTAALQNQFPSVYQPELLLADQTPESENTIKQVVAASKNLLMDENALQTLREYALTYKVSQFTIKWYCAGTDHNTYQLTIKAKGDPDPGKEIKRDPIDLSKLTADYVAQDGDVLTGTLGGNYKISIAPGAVVTLNGVTVNGTNDEAYNWAGISCMGNAVLMLADGSKNVVKGFYEGASGIFVPDACTLIIQGKTGSLDASSNGKACGIGGSTFVNSGNVEIQGGVITAAGGFGCAGIGSGTGQICGNVIISGGTVTATGGPYGAGIGSGRSAETQKAICGAITITGGTVTATGGVGTDTGGEEGAAGIGSGFYGLVGDITLSGGTITAVAGGTWSKGIGGGGGGNCSNITITKGVTSVTVTGDIGGDNRVGTITIEDGANVIRQ